MALFSCSTSRSISTALSLVFRRSLSSSSPVAGFVVSAASQVDRNASRQPLNVEGRHAKAPGNRFQIFTS
jgi:hypothetical protein